MANVVMLGYKSILFGDFRRRYDSSSELVTTEVDKGRGSSCIGSSARFLDKTLDTCVCCVTVADSDNCLLEDTEGTFLEGEDAGERATAVCYNSLNKVYSLLSLHYLYAIEHSLL